jgi:hypothetical protein
MKKYFSILNTQLNRINLKFIDISIEKEFHAYYAEKYLFQLRLAKVLAVFFFTIAAFGDFLFIEFNPIQILSRILIAVPAFIIGYILTFIRRSFYLKHYQIFNCIYVLLTGLSFIYVATIATAPVNYFFYSGLIISLIFNYTFIKQDFIKASIIGNILLIIYFISLSQDIVYFSFAFHGILYISIMNFLGMFIAYTMELDGRKRFLFERNLKYEKSKLNTINSNLEITVENKTQDLKKELSEKRNIEKELIKYQDNLEKIITERTKELEDKNKELVDKNKESEIQYKELKKYHDLFVGREFRIKELRDEIKLLKAKPKK